MGEFEVHNSKANIAHNSNVLSTIKFSGSKFIGNSGTFLINSGSVQFNNVLFLNNTASSEHDSILEVRNLSEIYFQESAYFINNKGKLGGAISSHNSRLFFKKNGMVYFTSNRADSGGAVCLTNKSSLTIVAETEFTKNKAQGYGGAIYVDDSTLIIEGYKLNLTKNDADHRGAISLTKGAIIEIHSKLDIIISHNTAQNYGGGIFVDDAGLWEGTSQHKCFVQRANTSVNYTIQFKRNKEVAGIVTCLVDG